MYDVHRRLILYTPYTSPPQKKGSFLCCKPEVQFVNKFKNFSPPHFFE